jgi:hypothetical protein
MQIAQFRENLLSAGVEKVLQEILLQCVTELKHVTLTGAVLVTILAHHCTQPLQMCARPSVPTTPVAATSPGTTWGIATYKPRRAHADQYQIGHRDQNIALWQNFQLMKTAQI